MRLRFLEFKDNDNLTTVWVGVMDLLIAAPRIGYGTSSQMYTALLVRIVMLSMGLWFFSRLYVKGGRLEMLRRCRRLSPRREFLGRTRRQTSRNRATPAHQQYA